MIDFKRRLRTKEAIIVPFWSSFGRREEPSMYSNPLLRKEVDVVV
jgi:hypothetical protein